jgi:hypothetical protein
MNAATYSAVIAGIVAIIVATLGPSLTHHFGKRREREADWRKVKLDLYKTYVVALSGVVRHNRTAEDQAKYADAINGLTLVASPVVLETLYRFQDSVSDESEAVSTADLDARLNALLTALRADIYSEGLGRHGALTFRLMSPPPISQGPVSHPAPGP